MLIDGKHYRSIWLADDARSVGIIDQQRAVLAACSSLAGKVIAALETANAIADEDVEICAALGRHGADRTARNGDVANKIGTYLKALAAHDNGIPFYVALPSLTFDPKLPSGMGIIPIEERDPSEVLGVRGRVDQTQSATISIYAGGTKAANPAFDVTPARLVTGYITEKGTFTPGTLAVGLGAGLDAGLVNHPATGSSTGTQRRLHG